VAPVKRVIWWVVFLCGLGGAYAYGQQNARWYRQTPSILDDNTRIEVFGDALTDTCYAVVFQSYQNTIYRGTAVSLGPVLCRKK